MTNGAGMTKARMNHLHYHHSAAVQLCRTGANDLRCHPRECGDPQIQNLSSTAVPARNRVAQKYTQRYTDKKDAATHYKTNGATFF